jgi:hypothetical protein
VLRKLLIRFFCRDNTVQNRENCIIQISQNNYRDNYNNDRCNQLFKEMVYSYMYSPFKHYKLCTYRSDKNENTYWEEKEKRTSIFTTTYKWISNWKTNTTRTLTIRTIFSLLNHACNHTLIKHHPSTQLILLISLSGCVMCLDLYRLPALLCLMTNSSNCLRHPPLWLFNCIRHLGYHAPCCPHKPS